MRTLNIFVIIFVILLTVTACAPDNPPSSDIVSSIPTATPTPTIVPTSPPEPSPFVIDNVAIQTAVKNFGAWYGMDGKYNASEHSMYRFEYYTTDIVTTGEIFTWFVGGEERILLSDADGASVSGGETVFFPADIYEPIAIAYFGVDSDFLRADRQSFKLDGETMFGDSIYYDPEKGGYTGTVPESDDPKAINVQIDGWEADGNIANIHLKVNSYHSDLFRDNYRMTLTVEITEDGERFISYKRTESEPFSVRDIHVIEAVHKFGSAVYPNGELRTVNTSLYTSDGLDYDNLTAIDVYDWASWYLSNPYTELEDKVRRYDAPERENASPNGEAGWFFPAEEYEKAAMAYFDVDVDFLRSAPEVYNAEYDSYNYMGKVGKGVIFDIDIEDYSVDGDIAEIYLHLSNESVEGELTTSDMTLTVEITAEGSRFISYLPTPEVPLEITDEVVRKAVINFGGAEQLDDTIRTQKVSGLYYTESLTAETLKPGHVMSWYFGKFNSRIMTMQQRWSLYENPRGEDKGRFFPAEEYEAATMAYFGVSQEFLQSNPEIYFAEFDGYNGPSFGGVGANPIIEILDYTVDGSTVAISLFLDYNVLYTPKSPCMTLTVEITEDGERFVSYLPTENPPYVLDVDVVRRAVASFGAELPSDGVATYEDLVTHAASLYHIETLTPETITPDNVKTWYYGYLQNLIIQDESLVTRYEHPLGADTGWFVPALEYEATAMEYFGVDVDFLRSDSEHYLSEHDGYSLAPIDDRAETAKVRLLAYNKLEGDVVAAKLILFYDGDNGEYRREMTLTLEITEDGERFVSYLPTEETLP